MLDPSNTVQLGDAIKQAAKTFDASQLYYGHGTDNAVDEASWLLLHTLNLSPVEPPDYSLVLNAQQIVRVNEVIAQRINTRQPAAYITGEAWFAGLRFKSDARALVPRSPLAEYITHDFFSMLDDVSEPRILDMCTGGGCIAIACAYAREDANIVASDISKDALELATENIALHELQSRVQLSQSNLFDSLNGRFDLIISNPPYVDQADLNVMADEFHHEPRLGLAAGVDGLDLVRIMLEQAPDYLNENGFMVIEVGNSAAALEEAYPHLPLLWLAFSHGGSGVFALTKQELLSPR